MNLLVGLLMLVVGGYLFYWALTKNVLEKKEWLKIKDRYSTYWIDKLPSFPKILTGYVFGIILLIIGLVFTLIEI